MKKKKILDIIKSGNFTLEYHDRGYCTLCLGKYGEYGESCPDEGDFKTEWESDNQTEGYIPSEVALLVEALGGKVYSV